MVKQWLSFRYRLAAVVVWKSEQGTDMMYISGFYAAMDSQGGDGGGSSGKHRWGGGMARASRSGGSFLCGGGNG